MVPTTAILCILLREEICFACSLVILHKMIRNVYKGCFSLFRFSVNNDRRMVLEVFGV